MIHHSTCSAAARSAVLHPVLLLVVGLVSWPADWDRVHAVLDSARSPEQNRAKPENHAFRYYIELIEGSAGPAAHGARRPEGWVAFRDADVVRFLDNDFLHFELKPGVRRTLFGQPFEINDHGMHDEPAAPEKPEGTFRIAVLGSSMDMGWGVRFQDTYVNQLQDWLMARSDAGAPGSQRRYEVLNFAVAAYSPLQRLETLRRKVLAFHPDLVIYSATTLDDRLMEIHLCDMLRNRVDLKYDFVRQAVDHAGVVADDLRVDGDGELIHKQRLKQKLRPFYWRLYDQTLDRISAECRSAGVPMAMVIIPRVGPADAPDARAEPVARLKALAAHNGITAFDLTATFDHDDPATLEIAAWDDHPNAMGHQRLFVALARALAADPTLSQLLFRSGPPLVDGSDLAGPQPRASRIH